MDLVDTNVISELAKSQPNSGVLSWASAVDRLGLSVITLEELQFGLAWKPNRRISEWLERFLADWCEVFPITPEIALRAGQMRGEFRAGGETRSQPDLLIASTAQMRQLTVVTRNEKDFRGCRVALLNPFA